MAVTQKQLLDALDELDTLVAKQTGGYMWNTWHTHNKNKNGQDDINNSILDYLKKLTNYIISKK